MAKKINAVLLIYHYPIKDSAKTIDEHITSFGQYSREKIYSVNTEYGFPSGLYEYEFKIIIFHYSIFTHPKYLLNRNWLHYLDKDEASYRIAFFQDEYQSCKMRFDFINMYRIKCIYSLLEESEHDKVYYKYTNVEKVFTTLTGYVSPELVDVGKRFCIPFAERAIDVSYRARHLDFCMGRGAQEKMDIGRKFQVYASQYKLKHDIKVSNHERFCGWDWHLFLANSKAVLGVEAGVSIFDLNDEVRISCEALLAENPEIDFETVADLKLNNWEGNVYYRMISPRIFEAAALRVVQILFEGKYSGILVPYEHYIPLKKDFSNIDEVISLFNNSEYLDKVTDAAYQHLVSNERFSYQNFISEVDQELIAVSNKGFFDYNLDSFFQKVYQRQEKFKYYRLLFTGKNFIGKFFLKSIFLTND